MNQDYNLLIDNSEKSKGQKKEYSLNDIFCWFFSITLWTSIIIILYLLYTENYQKLFENEQLLYSISIISYLMCIISELFSNTSKLLYNKQSRDEIYQKMGKLFKTPPKITFECQCYHYRIVNKERIDGNGNVEHYSKEVKEITYTGSYNMPYYSSRDISGLFYLNCEEAYIYQKYYVGLILSEEINFADKISILDYKNRKNDYYNKNRKKDEKMDFKETRTIPGLVTHNLVSIGRGELFFVNFAFFLISTLLGLGELYKIYINRFLVYQKYKIRKIISTRFNLNQSKYSEFNPRLNLISQELTYEPETYNYINDDASMELPTQLELQLAEKYQNEVPVYTISNGNGDNKPGVIIDDPRNYNRIIDVDDAPIPGEEGNNLGNN